MRWHYKGIVPLSVAGFNPLGHEIYDGRHSYRERLLMQESTDLSGMGDWYVYEAFFAVHDYMHIWAVRQLLGDFPHCAVPGDLKTLDAMEDLAFLLLMSEVVATATLDWWMLAMADVPSELGYAGDFLCLTTTFKLGDLERAHVIAPDFNVLGPEFMVWLAQGFFSGVFDGFQNCSEDEWHAHAPWIEKEVRYGRRQRELVARWVSFLCTGSCHQAPLIQFSLDSPKRARSLESLATVLWGCFGHGRPRAIDCDMARDVCLPPRPGSLEFEFVDVLQVVDDLDGLDVATMTVEQFGFLAAQSVSLIEWSPDHEMTAVRFDDIVRRKDLGSVLEILRSSPAIGRATGGSVHLFLPN